MNKLSQETLVPMGVAIVVIGTVATWVSNTSTSIKHQAEQLAAMSETHGANMKLISEINSRLSRIEWSLFEKREKEK